MRRRALKKRFVSFIAGVLGGTVATSGLALAAVPSLMQASPAAAVAVADTNNAGPVELASLDASSVATDRRSSSGLSFETNAASVQTASPLGQHWDAALSGLAIAGIAGLAIQRRRATA